MEVKCVIGSSYGDEGKGATTDYLTGLSAREGKKALNVLYNGGAQRGHTVEWTDGFRHVFHTFGAGTRSGADSFYDSHYMINPLAFLNERKELLPILRENNTHIYVHPNCPITTPYDMLINQELENLRGSSRHGSCGFGIYETFRREEAGVLLRCWSLPALTMEEIKKLRDTYYMARVHEIEQERNCKFSSSFYRAFNDFELMRGFFEALLDFRHYVSLKTLQDLKNFYDVVIFEGAQGLSLDQFNKDEWPHLTPSCTGSDWICESLQKAAIDAPVEVVYVTRPYLTRHGAGPLVGQYSMDYVKETFCPDLTNVPNPWQETLRYAPMDTLHFQERTDKDFAKWDKKFAHVKKSFALTHCGEIHVPPALMSLVTSASHYYIPHYTDKEPLI